MITEINFVPLLVINLILLVITILLLIANRLLVTYGKCKITIIKDDKKKEVEVQGGENLLSYLSSNNIKISSSCAGKASCGYCKVQLTSGGGEMLPTEEIFMSREEKQANIRLACQVKVKNDVDVFIPDFILTVKEMIENETFDTRKKWLVRIE